MNFNSGQKTSALVFTVLMVIVLVSKIDKLADLTFWGWAIAGSFLAFVTWMSVRIGNFAASRFKLSEEISVWAGIAISLIVFGLLAIYILDTGMLAQFMQLK